MLLFSQALSWGYSRQISKYPIGRKLIAGYNTLEGELSMDNSSLLIPAVMVVFGLIVLLVYVLCVTIREMSRRLSKMNELLLLAWSVGEKDGKASRVLLARAMKDVPPQRPTKPDKLSGVAQKDGKKSGFTMTMGA